MATLVFWQVPLRFCNGEALANAEARKAPRMWIALTCMAKLSVDLKVLQGAGGFEVITHVQPFPSSIFGVNFHRFSTVFQGS